MPHPPEIRLYPLSTRKIYPLLTRGDILVERSDIMNMLEVILNAQGGATVREAGRTVGLSQDQTSAALSALVPVLAAGLHRNATQQGGLDALLNAVRGGGHARYVDQPATLGSQETIADGNGILGHILGSKDVSRAVATHAATQTGIGADVLKKLLPIAATLVMASMAKQQVGQPTNSATGGGDLFSMLTPMLYRNRDGSMVDDILGNVGKMLGGR